LRQVFSVSQLKPTLFVRQRALAADSGTIVMGVVRLVRAVRQQLVIYLGWLRHLYFLFISGNIRQANFNQTFLILSSLRMEKLRFF
jgi:hypothetical protein